MSFLADVRQGRVGVRFPAPERLEISEERERSAVLLDPERGLAWTLLRSDYQIDLRAEHHELLAQDVERQARDLFERCFQGAERPADDGLTVVARTEDPEWSPVVEVERARIGGAGALRVVHRVRYEPAGETVVGHLLVPLAEGMFELRVQASAPEGGRRESALSERVVAEAGDRDPMEALEGIGQAYFDDPRHDGEFPDDPLSLVRSALRWVVEESGVEVTAPAPAEEAAEVEAARAGFAVTPPPRYAQMTSARLGAGVLRFSRVSLSATDGLQVLTVARLKSQSSAALTQKDLVRLAEASAQEDLPPGATGVTVEARALPAGGRRPHIRVYRSHEEKDGAPQHTASRWFVDESGRIVMVALGSAQCVPAEELFEEVESVVRSYRLTRRATAAAAEPEPEPASKKPWWRFW